MLGCGIVKRASRCALLRIGLVANHRRRVEYRLTGVKYPVGNSLGCNSPHDGTSKDVSLLSRGMRFIRPMSGRAVMIRTPLPSSGL